MVVRKLQAMIFNSFQFLWLFPLVFLGYYFLPSLFPKIWRRDSRAANMLLLAISYGLYMQWNPAYAFILLGVTAATYIFALRISGVDKKCARRWLVACGAILTLFPLLVFKYYNFIVDSFASVFHHHEEYFI